MKRMKKISLILTLFATIFIAREGLCQSAENNFSGAKATLKHYNALYVINSNDVKRNTGTLRNIKNALEDPRLKDKLTIELVAFGDGVAVFEKDSPFGETLKSLQAKGVILAQCENTIRERHIEKDQLFPFINFVPSGNGEIIIRHYQGWAVVHP
jgi:intracellular sulfur oxidation DsrE/DsrF family protein